jgi:glycosyltransferase involved in cell wall biosynthesis
VGRPLKVGLFSPYFGSTYGGGEKYLGVTAEVLRDAYPHHQLDLLSPVPVDRDRYHRVLGIDLRGINLRASVAKVSPAHRLLRKSRLLRPVRNRVVARRAAQMTAEYDLYLAMIYRIAIPSRARCGVILCQFPYPTTAGLGGYARVICQSEYVRGWVASYWKRDADVVPPPIDLPATPPDWSLKRQTVLSVGRFVAGGHVKRHDVMIEAFRRLCDSGLYGWELHLAGGTHDDAASVRYYRRLETMADGYPIRLHPDIDLAGLRRLYSEASIYWHAAGYGAPAGDPASLEHFGMTTAEAMAYGAVPVAVGLGGQPEVVEEDVSGYLWHQPSELEKRTRQLVDDPRRRLEMAAAARSQSLAFGREQFRRKLLAVLSPLIAELETTSVAAC